MLRVVVVLWGVVASTAVFAAPLATDCSTVKSCFGILGTSCGWCWDDSYTHGERHGAMSGSAAGPSGGTCDDWTWYSGSCHSHVDCNSTLAIPTCRSILGTSCGWCADGSTKAGGRGMRGTASGPSGSAQCSSSDWIWSHSSCNVQPGPQQIHLSFPDAYDKMTVTWAASTNESSTVTYAPDSAPTHLRTVSATVTVFDGSANPDGVHNIYRANMTGLVPGAKYTYTVRTGAVVSDAFTFTAVRNDSNFLPRVLVFGDMGRHGGGYVLEDLKRELDAGTVDLMIHNGDFAYDLNSDGGENGDAFLNRIQPIAARLPYMTAVGNHEIEGGAFANYRNRFSMPHGEDASYRMWYSFDFGKFHFIAYSSEVYFARTQDIDTQKKWLINDLARANQQRERTPWVVAFAHRPMYCSNADGDDCTKVGSKVRAGLEQVLHEGGVDVRFEAHEHSYERLWPTYNETVMAHDYTNPKAMTGIVTGMAGCNEGNGACVNPILKAGGPWSAFRSSLEGQYCYTHLHAFNTTHLYVDSFISEADAIEDKIIIRQDTHGPRQ